MSGRWERWLLALTPAVAMATVGLGLRVGAGEKVRAAMVYGAPDAKAGTGQAWQLAVFDEERGVREPVKLAGIDVVARAGTSELHWQVATNEDGAAELGMPLKVAPDHIEVSVGGKVLVSGQTQPAPPAVQTPAASQWARFARRAGPISLDVAVLGQRAASGFPASLWIRASDATTGAARDGAAIHVESDPALTPAEPTVTTDALGWAHLIVTPMGFSVPLLLHAEYAGAQTGPPGDNRGEWAGGLFISPGGSRIAMQDRYVPGAPVALEVTVPTVRKVAYVEVDSAAGRAWAAAAPLPPSDAQMPRAALQVPPLAPGLYWAVAADDPTGASTLGPGTMARPFFVADSDDAALLFGTDPDVCALPRDIRETSRILAACLALVAPAPVARWTALDGFAFQRARDAHRRAQGLSIALGAIAVAVILEVVLLLRIVAASRARLRAASREDDAREALRTARVWGIVVSLLVAMLGFALLGAFLVRLG
ncbi:MAG TPA: hypothetical protein VF765_18120 [Polyangiaceae bacterium]